jgi:C-terminal processing protease CtpA/Prc
VIDPLIEGLQKRPQLSDKGRLYVLIGRGTFSSGMMAAVRFRQDLAAILVGEGSGSPPNEYGEVESFILPNSNIQIEYTTKFFRLIEDSDPQMLEPDISVQLSIADLLSGHDPVFETALKHRWPVNQPAASR